MIRTPLLLRPGIGGPRDGRKRRYLLRCAPFLGLLTLSLLCAFTSLAQSQPIPPPTVSGTVTIGLSRGALSGDLCLAPEVAHDTLTVVLNRSLSITATRGGRYLPGLSVEQPGGAAIRHRVLRTGTGSAEHDPVCIVYEGVEPVHDVRHGSFRETDASEVIAFNGTTVRARGAARWYPAIYDPATGLTSESASFRITVRCEECGYIYLNGAAPTPGPLATLEASGRRELLLLAGDFPIHQVPGALVLGDASPRDSIVAFVETLTRIRWFQERFLGVPFGNDLVLLRVDPVRRPKKGLLWGFYSHPTLSLLGMSMSEFIAALDKPTGSERRSIFGLLGHELGHRYFAWTLGWRSPQRDLFGEPFASYLELKTLRHFLGERTYRRALRSLVRRVRTGETPVPLSRSTAADYAYDSYRYGYAPLQLLALETIIGEIRMTSLLKAMLEAPEAERAVADFDFIRRTALGVGVTAEEWTKWVRECVETAPRESRCLDRVAEP